MHLKLRRYFHENLRGLLGTLFQSVVVWNSCPISILLTLCTHSTINHFWKFELKVVALILQALFVVIKVHALGMSNSIFKFMETGFVKWVWQLYIHWLPSPYLSLLWSQSKTRQILKKYHEPSFVFYKNKFPSWNTCHCKGYLNDEAVLIWFFIPSLDSSSFDLKEKMCEQIIKNLVY